MFCAYFLSKTTPPWWPALLLYRYTLHPVHVNVCLQMFFFKTFAFPEFFLGGSIGLQPRWQRSVPMLGQVQSQQPGAPPTESPVWRVLPSISGTKKVRCWVVVSNIFEIFTPKIGKIFHLTSIFFRWVKTTNQWGVGFEHWWGFPESWWVFLCWISMVRDISRTFIVRCFFFSPFFQKNLGPQTIPNFAHGKTIESLWVVLMVGFPGVGSFGKFYT